MTDSDPERQLAEARRRILELEEELAETNRGLMALTMELEQRVEQRTEALRARKADLKEAQRLAHIGSWHWDAKTNITTGSDELLRIFDLDPATQTMPDFKEQRGRCYPVEDWERVNAAMQRTLETGLGYELDVRAFRNGGMIWITTRGGVVRDANDRIVGLRGTVQDITERKQAEEALRELNATLEKRVAERTAELEQRARQLQKLALELSQAEDRERKRLAAILHDDLQQQIAAVKFHVGLIGSRVKGDPFLQKATAKVDEMLMEAVEKSRRLSHELSPAILHQGMLGEALRWLANQMQTKHGLTVHVEGDGRVNSDSDALKTFLYRAAQELLFNVVKHARTDQARVRLRRLGRCLCLSVSDRGRGFDPQTLKVTKGFGLLSIRERIELLGGRMTIRSSEGQGSTFFMAIPDVQLARVGRERESPSRPPPVQWEKDRRHADKTGKPRLRVLLADDHEIMRQGLAALFAEESDIAVVGEASDGREAIDQACRLQPDVIVMDVSMPLIEGDEATRQIKTHLPETRVIALSMFHEKEVAERMREAGAESYVLKTASSDELLAAIRGEKSGPQ